jgi:hypothetical protein
MIAQQRGFRLLVVILSLGSVNSALAQQSPPSESGSSCGEIDYRAVEVVENLWNFASTGRLLNSESWTQASSGYFTKPSNAAGASSVRVVSNRYGISSVSREGDKVEITVQSEELGRIDSELRFIPTPSSNGNPDFYVYRLLFGPTPLRWYGPDGKTLVKETMTGPNRWRIEGSLGYRWTTLNTAIRYVLDERDKSKDPVITKNAEETLVMLRNHK